MKGQGVTDCRGVWKQAGHTHQPWGIFTPCAIGANGGGSNLTPTVNEHHRLISSPPSFLLLLHVPNILLLAPLQCSPGQLMDYSSYSDLKSPPSAVGKNPGNWMKPSRLHFI